MWKKYGHLLISTFFSLLNTALSSGKNMIKRCRTLQKPAAWGNQIWSDQHQTLQRLFFKLTSPVKKVGLKLELAGSWCTLTHTCHILLLKPFFKKFCKVVFNCISNYFWFTATERIYPIDDFLTIYILHRNNELNWSHTSDSITWRVWHNLSFM